jgi:5'/3'-nucleotidase SurE
MEAALCQKKAIALSFAFSKSEIHSQDTISATSRVAVGIIDHLYHHWDQGVELYNVNVPPVHDDQTPKAYYTTPLRNYWQSPSFYERVDSSDKPDTNHSELQSDLTPERPAEENLPYFQWAPVKTDVQHSIETSPPGTDAWATREGFVR